MKRNVNNNKINFHNNKSDKFNPNDVLKSLVSLCAYQKMSSKPKNLRLMLSSDDETNEMELDHHPHVETNYKYSVLNHFQSKNVKDNEKQSPSLNSINITNNSPPINENINQNKLIQPKNKIKIPPIVITKYELTNQEEFISDLEKILTGEFNLKFIKDGFKIFTETEDDYKKLKNFLKDIEYFTYTRKNDKLKKLVLKASPNMNVDYIKNKLIEQDVNVINCFNLKSYKNNNSYSYLIHLANQVEINKVKKNRIYWQNSSKMGKFL